MLDKSRRAKGLGKGVRQGRIWTYVRDQRPWAGSAPPGAVYYFAADRKGEHVRHHLRNTSGILQADAYPGFKDLYEKGPDGTQKFQEAACWAHLRSVRRCARTDGAQRGSLHDVWTGTKSGIAKEALDRIGKLYDIEREVAGQPPDVRRAIRQEKSKPRVKDFYKWAERQLPELPGKGDLAKAFRYGLSRWTGRKPVIPIRRC